jgi:hypothetical protein
MVKNVSEPLDLDTWKTLFVKLWIDSLHKHDTRVW